MTPLRIIFAGSGEFGLPTLRAILDAGHQVVQVVTQPDRPAGRGRALRPTAIGELETAGELHDRLATDGAPLLLRVLEQLSAGTAIETPQDESQATLAPKLSREASRIDWNRPATEIANQIRGMYPWPGCRVRLL